MSVEYSIGERKAKHTKHVERDYDQKGEKVAIVAPANAVVYPGTVMVQLLNAPLKILLII